VYTAIRWQLTFNPLKKDIIKDNADQEENNSYSKLAERQKLSPS
jgi:hypothetical protein